LDITAVRRWWPFAAVLGLLAVAALAATRSRPQLDRFHPSSRTPGPQPPQPQPSARAEPSSTPLTTAHEAARGLPDWIGTAADVLLVLAFVVICAFVVRAIVRDRQRRRGVGPVRFSPAVTSARDDVVAALDAGIEELIDSDNDPRRAVIACWVRLEQVAASAGIVRATGDSPTDLVGRLLATRQVDAGALAGLAAAYREARYATHTVDDRMRRQAVQALRRLRTDLGAPADA
jgi:Domain of unknown function (DUF4129)